MPIKLGIASLTAAFATKDIVKIDSSLYAELIERAKEAHNLRSRVCLHKDHSSPIQEMVIALGKSSYVRPHHHPEGRVESYTILEGEMDVFVFDNEGVLIDKISLSSDKPGEKIVRITNMNWHMPVAKSEWVIYHEILQGPFEKDEVVKYASWAPEETDSENSQTYLKGFYGK